MVQKGTTLIDLMGILIIDLLDHGNPDEPTISQPSTNHQPSTINHQPSTNHQTTRHNPLDASFPDGLCVSIFRHELWLFVDPLIEEFLPVGCDM